MFESPARAHAALPPLLGPDDPPPFEILNPGGKASLLLICDHASNAMPAALGRLGLDEAYLRHHIALDVGAAPVTRRLSKRFDAPAVLCGYSRLVIDCNRRLDDPTSIPVISDGVIIPGNRDITRAEAERRAEAIFHPYHRAVAGQVSRLRARGVVPVLFSVHSFTPRFRDEERPWHVGVLWDRDPRIAVPLIEKLSADASVRVGDNKPYSGRDHYTYTVDAHAADAGLAHAAVEIRQDLIESETGAERWAERLGDVLADILDEPGLYRVARFAAEEAAS